MKNMLTFLLVAIPLFLYAQDDDYCSCMDEYQFQVDHNDLFYQITEGTRDVEFLTIFTGNVDTETETESEGGTEITLDEYHPFPINQEPLQINVSPTSVDDNIVPEAIGNADNDTVKAQQKTRMSASSSSGKSKIKKSKKMFSKRVKRRPKAKKYRGKCPSF